jgi:xanthine dehydrogenase molybdopterin binding subunit/xanthine dehydrogenase small subunit
MAFEITVNGHVHRVDGVTTHMTLLRWLRERGLTGTKEGCAEGDCGACTVAVVERRHDGRTTYRAINACIALLPAFAGREVVTVEGLRSAEGKLHPVQRVMVEEYGSQCGFCTPGFVVSMFEGYYRDEVVRPEQITDQLSGNLCRCTGYRPIRDAMSRAVLERSSAAEDPFRARLEHPPPAVGHLDYEHGVERFLRPTTLQELCDCLLTHPHAYLVAGATEVGVEINKKAKSFPLLVGTDAVEELRGVRKDERGWHIGGAATLTELEEAIEGELPSIAKMLRVFASRQIRSRATLAGNLVTASPIGDMAPVLLSLDAVVLLVRTDRPGLSLRTRRVPLADFFLGYRKTAIEHGELLALVEIPFVAPKLRRRSDSYKVSKRRELDIAIVAAGFSVDTDEHDVVRRARLAFGGVAATPIRALRTEALLLGRPWNEATFGEAIAVLGAEFTPIDDVRGSATLRRGLITSLFEKFFRGATSEAMDGPLDYMQSARIEARDASRALPHESGVGHVTGSARYVDDEVRGRPMLDVWPVCAPHARARIVRRDATQACAMSGVTAVLFAEDVPGLNDIGAVRHDEPLLAKDEVSFNGQIVALVVGDSLDACRAGAAAVEVDYEALPAILTIEAAIEKASFHTEPSHIRRGDVPAALEASPHRVAGVVQTGAQEHFYLESQAAWAEPGDDGDVFVSSSTQHPSEIQTVVAHVLGVPRHKVVVQSPRMGGGFGGKETQGNGIAALVAIAAVHTGRPVRMMLDRDVDMVVTGKRHPFRIDYDAGFDDQGNLLALYAELVADGGWALDLSEAICDRALFHADNAYYVPAMHVVGRVAKTNHCSHTAFRGFGGPQGMMLIEEVMGRIARTLGLPPEQVRRKNLYRGTGESATTHYGQHIDDNRIERVWDELCKTSELGARRAELDAFNAKSAHVKRGLAITPVKFGISFTATFLNQAGALVLAYRDGTVQVNHGGTEMGQGLYTKIRGVAMRELGLAADAVRVMKTRTDKVPNTSATAASAGADLNGAAVRVACEALRERLAPLAATMLAHGHAAPSAASVRFEDGAVVSAEAPGRTVSFAALCDRAHVEQISLSASGYYRTPGIAWDKKAGKGKPFHYFAFGAAVCEVEIDGLSGMKRVRRVDVLHDVGDSLNSGVDRGQIEGGFVQGMGWLTGEEVSWDASGRLLTHSASTYQIPSIGDAPFDFRVRLLPDAAQKNVIHGSKAVGEPPLMLAFSVREAIKDAIAAFGGSGPIELPSPATHEAIFLAIRRRVAS